MNLVIAQQNLALLQTYHSNVAKGLLDFLQRQREENKQPVFRVDGIETTKPILIKTDCQPPITLPNVDIQENLIYIQETQPETIIIWSCGLGLIPCALAPMIHRIKLAIVEPEYEILFCALQTTDWRPLLPSSNLLLLVGERANDKAQNLFETHGSILKNGYRLLKGRKLLPEEQTQYDELNSLVSTSFNRSKEPIPLTSEISPKRIAFAASEPHRDLLPVLSHEVQTLNFDAHTAFRPAAIKRWLQTDEMGWETLGTPIPAAVLTFSQTVFHPFEWTQFKEKGIERILWLFDDPFRFDRTKDFYSSLDRIFCFDPHLTELLKQESPIPVDYLPAAASFIGDCEFPKPADVPETIEISFVGSTGLQRFDERLLRWIAEKNDTFRSLHDYIENALQNGRAVSYSDLLSQEILFPGAEGISRIRILQDVATFLIRLHYLSALIDKPVTIYGDRGWAMPALVGEISQLYQGRPLDYVYETPWVYRHSQININTFNVQCVDSPTVRIFDTMACGGFMLTEYRPCIEKMFIIGQEIDVFRSRKELRDKIEYYQSHPERRLEVAKAGQSRVLKEHRYQNRLRQLIKILNIDKKTSYHSL